MKKLINAPDAVVTEALDGMAAAHPGLLKVFKDPHFIMRADAPVKGKVALVSGGGAGHEPLHGGFVGRGMLDAACPGAVFTSPTPDQMLAATQAVNGGAGVLHIVKNYTGDVLNFEMAADLAKGEGIDVESVIINDDVAVKDSTWTAGRRGVATTVLAEKICGAAAEAGMKLADVASLCRKVNDHGRTMGMALTSCTVPHAGKPSFDLADDEMENRHRHSWRAGPPSRQARAGRPHRRDADGTGARRSAVQGRRRRTAVRQRHGRHAFDRALRRVPQGSRDRAEARAEESCARWSAPTSPAWRWPAPRSRC